MPFKLTAAAAILNQMTGKATGGILPTCYLGLSSTVPNDDGTNFSEPSGGGYARVLLGASAQSLTQKMGTPANRATENVEIIYFPETTAQWSGLTRWGLFTSASGGTPEIWGTLTGGPITIPSGYIPLFRVGSFGLSIA